MVAIVTVLVGGSSSFTVARPTPDPGGHGIHEHRGADGEVDLRPITYCNQAAAVNATTTGPLSNRASAKSG